MSIGFSLDDAVELMQTLVALAVGFALFGAPGAIQGVRGLPPEVAERMGDWREETSARTARLILDSLEDRRRT